MKRNESLKTGISAKWKLKTGIWVIMYIENLFAYCRGSNHPLL